MATGRHASEKKGANKNVPWPVRARIKHSFSAVVHSVPAKPHDGTVQYGALQKDTQTRMPICCHHSCGSQSIAARLVLKVYQDVGVAFIVIVALEHSW